MQLAQIADNSADLKPFLSGVTDEVRDITASAKAQGDLKFTGSPGTAKTAPQKKQASQTYPCPGEACDGRLRRIKGKTGYFWGCTNYGQGCRETRPDSRGKPGKSKAKSPTAGAPKQKVAAVGETCPDCKKGKIQLRSLKSGKNAGKPFHGCSTFPKCRYFAWPVDP
jgi:DNA topoisomerase-3